MPEGRGEVGVSSAWRNSISWAVLEPGAAHISRTCEDWKGKGGEWGRGGGGGGGGGGRGGEGGGGEGRVEGERGWRGGERESGGGGEEGEGREWRG